MLIIAFDSATDVATAALVRDGATLGERASRAVRLLEDVDALFAAAGVEPTAVDGIVVGTGPGSYTGLRMGLVTARVLSLSLDAPVAGVSTLDALAAGAPGALPVIDARRGEVFTLHESEPAVLAPQEVEFKADSILVGDGAARYREVFKAVGALIPPDDDPRHIPWARHHAAHARDFGPAEDARPLYLRVPDAERAATT